MVCFLFFKVDIMAELKFYYGCMNAGKSVNVIKTYEIYRRKRMNPVIIKPAIDDRHGKQEGWGFMTSKLIKEPLRAFYIKNMKEDLQKVGYDKIILVDEAQFFSREDIIQLANIVEQENVNIVAYGLKNDTNGQLFEGSKALIEFADKIQEIEMVCEEPGCMNKASQHLRYIDGQLDKSQNTVAIEKGNITYQSVCRKHWLEKKNYLNT